MTKKELKNFREKMFLTQVKMAEKLFTPLSTYKKWEQGRLKIPGIVDVAIATSTSFQ